MGRSARRLGVMTLGLLACDLDPVAAQSGALAVEDCTYQSCSLWLDYPVVAVGERGESVASFGWFSEPELRPMIELSDSAAHYYGIVEDNYASGSYLTFFGALVAAGGISLAEGKQEPLAQWIAGGMLAGGLGTVWLGNRRVERAREALAESIWWYNEELEQGAFPADAPFSPRVQAALREDQARTGAVLGLLGGLGLGLLVSSRDSDISVARGLSETLLFGLGGTLLGRRIGFAVER